MRWGSPPHLRGKQQQVLENFELFRITPAPAGKTIALYDVAKTKQDHPRTCGENHLPPNQPLSQSGSPPHLRGKQFIIRRKSIMIRITPAPAGKTLTISVLEVVERDHPRTCGENYAAGVEIPTSAGSPPHLRGKHDFFVIYHTNNGITPAPAGKTSLSSTLVNCFKDHPRTCGENQSRLSRNISDWGSPPHLRGKRFLDNQKYVGVRITPAPAGKTSLAMKEVSQF